MENVVYYDGRTGRPFIGSTEKVKEACEVLNEKLESLGHWRNKEEYERIQERLVRKIEWDLIQIKDSEENEVLLDFCMDLGFATYPDPTWYLN